MALFDSHQLKLVLGSPIARIKNRAAAAQTAIMTSAAMDVRVSSEERLKLVKMMTSQKMRMTISKPGMRARSGPKAGAASAAAGSFDRVCS